MGAETRDSLSDARPPAVPFTATEELYYEGEFSKLMLRGIDIVEIRFSAALSPQAPPAPAASKETKVRSNYLFTAEATSKGWFSKLFGWRFNHRIESTVEAGSFTALRTGKTDEQGKRVRTSEAIFDRAADKITWTERDPNAPAKPPRVVSSNVCGAVHDVISAFYFLRTQPLAPNQAFNLTVTDSGKIYQLPARVVETKKIKTALGEMPAVRVDVEIFGPDRLVKSQGEFSVWFSADAKRLPLQARVNTDLGTLEIKLKKVAG
ncbi:MAG TPA: DUF3108 domain-containing protein [Pyrinomonadaceae bacterium]|nr:DUF3108 domain-containing protein [Pyrinomonadaceae bacterium]